MAHSTFRLPLHSTNQGTAVPPDWASGDKACPFWYHENEHGEQWVARLEGGRVQFAGMDIGWEGFEFNLQEATTELNRLRTYFRSGIPPIPAGLGIAEAEMAKVAAASIESLLRDIPMSVAGIILGEGELYWVAGVLDAAIPRMETAARKKKG